MCSMVQSTVRLKTAGCPTIPFLSSPDLSKPSLIMIYIWLQGAAVTTFLAALQDVPRSLYEAARPDGATVRTSSGM